MNHPIAGLILAVCCLSFMTESRATEAAAPFAAKTVAERDAALQALENERRSPETAMTLATWQALSSIEQFGQALHRHGFRSPRITLLPLLRLPVPENATPETMTYETWRSTLAELVADLDKAKTMLADIPDDAEIGIDVDLNALRFDLNSDGLLDESESVAVIFQAISGPQRRGRTARAETNDDTQSPPLSPSFRFDRADGYWLQGYANFVSANARMWLAHDFSKTFDTSFQMFFPGAGMAAAAPDRADAARQKINAQIRRNPYLGLEFAETEEAEQRLSREIEALPASRQQRLERDAKMAMMLYQRELRGTGNGGFNSEVFDATSLIHTVNWPVAYADARAEIRLDLLEMVRLSRLNWRSIQAETDNEREWLPGPQQSGPHPLTTLEVSGETVAAWHDALDLFENALEGRILLPHIRFADRGFNLKRFFDEPTPFDLVLTITGPGAQPYLETGSVASNRDWRELTRAFGRNGFWSYAIWFN
ncbi:hypothetical protein ABWH89_14600 [Hoeflea alexandrii]|uniref:hypothetical protein n=1 Tax=Hoeflea alexandrii TaxID=288436 RepID=UPI0035CFC286